MNKRNIAIAFIFIISFGLIFHHIGNFPAYYFDETHYLKAAIDWIHMNPNTNLEHPPLGKLIMATGIKLFGENPLGFRIMNVYSGVLTILVIFLIAEIVFADLIIALLVALFSLFNFWIFIHSRIAMLDIFLVQFFVMSLYFYLKFEMDRKKLFFWLSSFFWGITVAIKWSGVFLYVPFYFFILFTILKEKEFKRIIPFLGFGLFSVIIYFITFLPYMFTTSGYHYGALDLIIRLPFTMLELQSSVPGEHPYASKWFTWPFMIRPMWYEFKQFPITQTFRGVFLIGNPWQMFIGFLSTLFLVTKFKKISSFSKMLVMTYFFYWCVWGILPRKAYFFYYFFPISTLYSFFVPMMLKELFDNKKTQIIMGLIVGLSIWLFIYFYPILSGDLTAEAIRLKWYWFQSWI